MLHISANKASSGNIFMSLTHCALIESLSFSYVIGVSFFTSFLKCGCFSTMYSTYLINIILLLMFGYIALCI